MTTGLPGRKLLKCCEVALLPRVERRVQHAVKISINFHALGCTSFVGGIGSVSYERVAPILSVSCCRAWHTLTPPIYKTMPDYFYFDQANQKCGPIDEQQLRELAATGIIKSATPMETAEGHKGIAKQIPGLLFATSATSSSPVPEWYGRAAIRCGIVCVAFMLVALGAKQYAWHLLAQYNSGAEEVTIGAVRGYFRLYSWVGMLHDIVLVAGMFFGSRGMSTNKARIAKIGLILCIITFAITRLYFTWEMLMR